MRACFYALRMQYTCLELLGQEKPQQKIVYYCTPLYRQSTQGACCSSMSVIEQMRQYNYLTSHLPSPSKTFTEYFKKYTVRQTLNNEFIFIFSIINTEVQGNGF